MKAGSVQKLLLFVGFLMFFYLHDGFLKVAFAAPETPVHFTDDDLEKKVRQALGYPAARDIYPSDMLTLTELDAGNSEINSLNGLEHAKNLKKLNLANNYLINISLLNGLASLEYLDLSKNRIKTVQDIKSLPKLQTLLLNNTDIYTLEPLLHLSSLKYVEVKDTYYLNWYDDFQQSSAKMVSGTLSYQKGVTVVEPELQTQRLSITSKVVTDNALAIGWEYYGNRPNYFRISINSIEVAKLDPDSRAFIIDGLTPHEDQNIFIEAVFSQGTYTFDSQDFFTYDDGSMNGWLQLGNKKAYYNNNTGTVTKGWFYDSGKWFYFDEVTGVMKTSWVTWNGKSYFLDIQGSMKTGWVKDNGIWYYFDKDGALKSGWLRYNNQWYYLQGKHGMKIGWLQYNTTWYYHDYNGVMKTGWVKNLGKWYYMDSSGAMQKGWKYINNKWYYFYNNGAMAVNTYIGSYKIGSDGAWIK